MNCPRCGTEMEGGVCPECGFPVTRWRRKCIGPRLSPKGKGRIRRKIDEGTPHQSSASREIGG